MSRDPFFVFLHGGMCNQLFQVATAYAHAKRNGYSLKISQTATGRRPTYFKTILHKFAPYIGEPHAPAKLWIEPTFSYTPIPAEMDQIRGFYQSTAYFQDVSSEIVELFTLPPPLKFAVEHKHAALLTPMMRSDAIVVHVRRTDYVGSLKHGILDTVYYERAVARARTHNPDGPLLVFSDDLAWCRAQSVFAGAAFVDEPVDVAALYLMSQFRHIVMANSTFSWWAAYLGPHPKTVIAPSRWFGPTGPQDTQDIYMGHWHIVDV